jgi:hypothetical protein
VLRVLSDVIFFCIFMFHSTLLAQNGRDWALSLIGRDIPGVLLLSSCSNKMDDKVLKMWQLERIRFARTIKVKIE